MKRKVNKVKIVTTVTETPKALCFSKSSSMKSSMTESKVLRDILLIDFFWLLFSSRLSNKESSHSRTIVSAVSTVEDLCKVFCEAIIELRLDKLTSDSTILGLLRFLKYFHNSKFDLLLGPGRLDRLGLDLERATLNLDWLELNVEINGLDF